MLSAAPSAAPRMRPYAAPPKATRKIAPLRIAGEGAVDESDRKDNLFAPSAAQPSEPAPRALQLANAPKCVSAKPTAPRRGADAQQNFKLSNTLFDSHIIDVKDLRDAPLPIPDISTFVRIAGTDSKSDATFLPNQSGSSWVVRHPTCLWPQFPARSGGILDQHGSVAADGLPVSLPRDLPPALGVWSFDKHPAKPCLKDTQIPHDPAHEITHGTLALWVRPAALKIGMFLTKDDYSTGSVFQLGHTDKGRLILRMASNTTWSTKTPVLGDREWVHVAVTFTGSGAVVSLDGTQVPAGNWNPMTGDLAHPGDGAKLALTANRRPWTLTTGADAAIANFGIWGGAYRGECLTETEIRHLVKIGPNAVLRTGQTKTQTHRPPLALSVVVPSKKGIALRFGGDAPLNTCPDELVFHDHWRPRPLRRKAVATSLQPLKDMFGADAYEDEIMFA